jgi:protein O-mannosyl-transferase
VESVTWIAGMVKTVSYSIFFVGALITYLKYVRTGKIKFIVYTLLLFIGSCLCKEQAVALPLALLVLDLYLKRKLLSSKVMIEKIPFFIVSIIFGIITLKATGSTKPISTTVSFGFFDRIVYASYAIDHYLGKMIIPYKMSLFYPYPSMRKLGTWQYIYPLIFLGILGLFAWAIKKKKDYIIFGGLFFIVSILFSLALQIISVREVVMADRYIYVSSIGFFFILAYGAFSLSEKYKISSMAVYGIFTVYLVIIGYQTAQRTQVFKNTITATTDVLQNFPSKLAYVNRGYEYKHSGQVDKALSDYNNALLIDSTYAMAYRNRGVIYFERNNDSLALRDYTKSIKYDSTVAESYANRGACYSRMGKIDLALKDLNKALQLDPKHKSALNNRSLTYFNIKEYKKAIADLDIYLNLYPNEAGSINLRGLCKIGLKDYDGALADYNKSVQLEPNVGVYYQNRSLLHFHRGEKSLALKDAQQAQQLGIKMDPNYLNALK